MSEKKAVTVREFKMWLQGVEEMQEPGWIPNPTQWAKIREKLDSIVETAPTQTQPLIRAPNAMEANVPLQPYNPAPVHVVTAGPSSLAPPTPPQLSPALATGGGLSKTPDIDTSGKRYESGFV